MLGGGLGIRAEGHDQVAIRGGVAQGVEVRGAALVIAKFDIVLGGGLGIRAEGHDQVAVRGDVGERVEGLRHKLRHGERLAGAVERGILDVLQGIGLAWALHRKYTGAVAGDIVIAWREGKGRRVQAAAAIQGVVAIAATQNVVAAIAGQNIVMRGAGQPFKTQQRIGSGAAGVLGDADGKVDIHASGGAGVTGDVEAAAAIEIIVAGSALEDVVIGSPFEMIVSEAAGDVQNFDTTHAQVRRGRISRRKVQDSRALTRGKRISDGREVGCYGVDAAIVGPQVVGPAIAERRLEGDVVIASPRHQLQRLNVPIA